MGIFTPQRRSYSAGVDEGEGVAVGVCPTTFAAKTAQSVTAKINKPEMVGRREKSRSFITRDSSEESAGHKKLELRNEFLVLAPIVKEACQGAV
jgi:hypothetical protein